MHKHVPDRPIEKDELPVPEEIYPVIDNDLARDNIENDIPAASNPSTGDEFPVAAFVAIAAMSLLGMAVVVFAKKRTHK